MMANLYFPPATSLLRACGAAAIVLGALAVSGCGSTQTQAGGQGLQDGPLNSGTYPNLNIPPRSAAEPLTAQETSEKLSALKARSSAQASEKVKQDASEARLKALAKNHAKQTLDVIEGRCKAIDPNCE